MKMYAICDCDNCYCSCERVFRPDLAGKPVVVLSNNDGCVIARSREAKAAGIPMGLPYYQLAERFPRLNVAVFSSNYELYGDITRRVMSIIRSECTEFYRYSIDEAFCVLEDMDGEALKAWGERLSKKILKWVGMPVSIGIASTKTLAKCADYFAKNYPGYNHCCVIDTETKREKALKMFPVKEVWGIGRRMRRQLEDMNIGTAWDLLQKPQFVVRRQFHLPGERTWLELKGVDCVPLDEMHGKKSICTSRSFPGTVKDFDTLKTHVANDAAKCSEKLRKQGSVCNNVMVFIDTNRFRDDLPQYANSTDLTLLTPVNSTQEVVGAAVQCLRRIYREGYQYKRAGVIVTGIHDASAIQTDFMDFDARRHEKMQLITTATDGINLSNGSETVILGCQQYRQRDERGKSIGFRDAIRHQFRSKSYSLRRKEFLEVR